MAPSGPIDNTSKLVDEDIVLILSRLPFNEAARTSVLAQRWRHIWRGTRSVELLERFFVRPGDSEEIRENKRREFMEFVRRWINDSDRESEIDKFSFSLSNPKPFQDDLYAVLSFPSSRHVKELYLDFSDPSWEQDDPKKTHKAVCNIPGPVYRNHDLQSMKLYSCSFMDQWFGNFGSLKELSLGWIELESASMKAVMEKCPLLWSLSLERCWNRGEGMEIRGRNLKLRKLRIENCGYEWWCFDSPNLKEFKYSGRLGILHFDNVGTPVENVELDFGVEKEFQQVGDYLQMLLRDLTYARVLTICTYILQVISSGLQSLTITGRSLEIRHLILKIQLHPNEFWGIRFMLNNCSKLETITFDLVPGNGTILTGYVPPFELKPDDFWINNPITYKCLKTTLKVVVFEKFMGSMTEILLLQYFLNFGQVLEHLVLYAVDGLKEDEKKIVIKKAKEMKNTIKAAVIIPVILCIDGIYAYI